MKRILSVAESDTTGFSGIQADIKTVMALGGHAMTAISCLHTRGVDGIVKIHDVSPDFLALQIQSIIEGYRLDGIKIGFLQNEAAINAVADVLDRHQRGDFTIVVDPSVVTRQGQVLVDSPSLAAWKRRLYIHADALTPNQREAELLSGMQINSIDDMRHTAEMMRTLGAATVVLKSRQPMEKREIYVVATESEERVYEMPTLSSRHTLGAGSTFSTAITHGLSSGHDIFTSVEKSLDFLHQTIEASSLVLEETEGSVDHGFNVINISQRAPHKPSRVS